MIAWEKGTMKDACRIERNLSMPMLSIQRSIDTRYTYIYTYIHTYSHPFIHSFIHTYIHTYIPTHIHTHTHIRTHTYIHTNKHTSVHTYIDTHIYTYIHTYIHTYVRTSSRWTHRTSLTSYGVASINRMLKNIGLFCKIDLQKRPIFCKETYIFKRPMDRGHPIAERQMKRQMKHVWPSLVDFSRQRNILTKYSVRDNSSRIVCLS